MTVEQKAPRPPYSSLSVLKPTPKPALPPAQPAAQAAPAPAEDSENVVIRCKLNIRNLNKNELI